MWTQMKLMVSGIWAFVQPSLMLLLSTIAREMLRVGIEIARDAMTDPAFVSGRDRGAYVRAQLSKRFPEASNRLLNLVIELIANVVDPK